MMVTVEIPTVGLSSMVRRQTAKSRFSHFEPAQGETFDELERLISECFHANTANIKKLRPDGAVVCLTLPENACEGRFFSSVVKLEVGMEVRTEVAVRQGGLPCELPYIQSVVVGAKKTPSKWVDVILYHKDALEPEERMWTPPGKTVPELVDADWLVVSVNVHISSKGEPPTPQAMARNHAKRLGLREGVGGTPREYSDRDYMEAVLFWSSHAMVAGE